MRDRGFTIIEGLIVMAIVGLLLAAGAPAISDMLKNNRVRAVAEQMRDGLLTARLEAIRRNTAVRFVPSGTGWSVILPGVGLGHDTTLASRVPFQDESGINVAPSGTEATFNGGGRLTTTGTFAVRVTRSDGACAGTERGNVRCLTVEATRGGQIRMCDPAQPASSPEGC